MAADTATAAVDLTLPRAMVAVATAAGLITPRATVAAAIVAEGLTLPRAMVAVATVHRRPVVTPPVEVVAPIPVEVNPAAVATRRESTTKFGKQVDVNEVKVRGGKGVLNLARPS